MDRRLGVYLKHLRENKSMSLDKLAFLCDIREGYLSRIEAGTQLPGVKVFNLMLKNLSAQPMDVSVAKELYKDVRSTCKPLTDKEDQVLSLFQDRCNSIMLLEDIIFFTDYSRGQVSAILKCLKAKGLIKVQENGFKKVEG